MRRASLGAGGGAHGRLRPARARSTTTCYYGPHAARSPRPATSCSRRDAWRERHVRRSAPSRRAPAIPDALAAPEQRHPQRDDARHGRHGRRHGAQPAADRDGRHRRPAVLRKSSRRTGSTPVLDALYIVPQRVGKVRAAAASRRSRANTQIYFIGACNVPIEALDPALTRPGRMGRHIRFRTPTQGRPQGHLRPLPRQGLARARPRHRPPPRRARAHHGRLLAGDDRAGLLDGAHATRTTTGARASAGATSSRP